ncbi:conserved hypothetical protein [Treponema primitia ZAS-2]|uniref:LPS export ABC transporter periplasmic protein LptC n=1 Tax=Treponema primitia (strain ATCC BAA-887 / DSM 12427 / ZAS-2) TaxID=545694 RepID=F5YNG8_TREPZ|nr:LPS export ABC transporter periplasmic protein LptC [Treponema primitia]AEF84506.1 conserved hypothetical protein [Treponema primitia ZAS-2]
MKDTKPGKKRVATKHKFLISHFSFLIGIALVLLGSCSFDYGDMESENEDQPDIIMGEVEYVRMRDGDPVVRFRAQLAERYEKRQTMELRNFSFEQFYNHGDDVNASGRAGNALVELESGNILLEKSIIIAVESEDITIETDNLSWEDEPRLLTGGEEDTVGIQRSDGTLFSGKGFFADARSRTWAFSGGVDGTFVDKDEEDSSGEESSEEVAEPGSYPENGEPFINPEQSPDADGYEPMEPALWS